LGSAAIAHCWSSKIDSRALTAKFRQQAVLELDGSSGGYSSSLE
jgi:hypothetical protein